MWTKDETGGQSEEADETSKEQQLNRVKSLQQSWLENLGYVIMTTGVCVGEERRRCINRINRVIDY